MKATYRKPGFFYARADKRDKLSVKRKVKTAVRYREDLTRTPTSRTRTRLAEKNKTIPSHREDAKTPPSKLPLANKVLNTPPSRLITDSGDELEKDGRIGSIATYSNRPKPQLVNSFQKTMQKLKQADIENFTPPVNGVKRQTLTVTEKSLEKVAKQNKGKTRSQAKVMAAPGKSAKLASANLYAANTRMGNKYVVKGTAIRKNNKDEWLHLGAYAIGGAAMQDPLNLICQTEEMNTWMIPGEQQISYLAKVFPGPLKINIEAETELINVDGQIKPSHFAVGIIKYVVEVSTGLKFDFSVDCQYEAINPHKSYMSYLNFHVDDSIEQHKNPGLKI